MSRLRADTIKTPPPLRSLLFLPATSTHLLPKADKRGADALIVDLEDSVHPERKQEARGLAASAVEFLSRRGAVVLLRINAGSGQAAFDLEQVPLNALTAIMLPKVEKVDDVASLAAELDLRDAKTLPIVALIESPLGVLAAGEIAGHPRLCAIGFGAEDHAAALGVAPTPQALTWPACQVINCAHANLLQCWGLAATVTEVNDMVAWKASLDTARAIGFTGTVCIHPRQVEAVNLAFSPSTSEVEWARRVVAADHELHGAGHGAVLLDGRMIDKPVVERARRILGPAR